ncbi:long-chain-fatty-acid--CoA ligase [Streptacidiphilus sp. PAMC 29251]
MSFNLATMLRESAAASPAKACCRIGEQTMTYAQLDESSDRVAAGLLARGLVRGDKVAVQLPNIPEFLQAYFGILKAGLVMVPLNPQLKASEIAHQVTDSQARVAICFGSCVPEMAVAAEGIDGFFLYEVEPPDGRGVTEGFTPFVTLTSPQADRPASMATTAADDTAVIIYTSGTTGRPKGAELTHFQLYMNCTICADLFGIEAEDVSLAVLPFFHIYGLSSVLNAAVRYGGTLSVVPQFGAEAVVDALERHGVSVMAGVPTMYQTLLAADIEGRDLSRLRIGSCGGAAMPDVLLQAFEKKFGIVVLEGYGLSETASAAVFNRSAEDRRPLSIGKPMWGVEVSIVDGDGAELPPGPDQVGEVVLRGHNVMRGYYRNPEATAGALRDGWLHTGDLAYRDEDGFLYIVDRIKDLIIRGGYNVYPREVEEVLYAHPAVAEAAVIGRPDTRLGEQIVAFVALRPGAEADTDALIAHCRQRLAAYKCPREIRFLPELPKSGPGKLLKRELRPMLPGQAAD